MPTTPTNLLQGPIRLVRRSMSSADSPAHNKYYSPPPVGLPVRDEYGNISLKNRRSAVSSLLRVQGPGSSGVAVFCYRFRSWQISTVAFPACLSRISQCLQPSTRALDTDLGLPGRMFFCSDHQQRSHHAPHHFADPGTQGQLSPPALERPWRRWNGVTLISKRFDAVNAKSWVHAGAISIWSPWVMFSENKQPTALIFHYVYP